ncbi:RNA polymerase ECF-type sigma factor [Aquipluma nitroreducens]|uniref:RNA polymerase ECF-type sigma factor n=1 Tax=Aquipluma nitroreducens TaxID=2010828 RepID=A0A5K7S2N2_9BACT|nr:RNA polymerase sigma factor [Aquipluma nitroreducens]BBE15911.1 RNA polymerase ECF-type sigma factor [Aquipluma nitroreducens]
MNKTDDIYYIEAVRKGNVQAFSFLVEKYQKLVYTLALKLLKKPEEAEEMAQDTFIKAFQKLDSYEGKSKFSTWLYSITYNACISELRKRRIEFKSLDDRQISDQDEQKMHDYYRETRKEDQEKYLNLALAKLPEDDQVLVTLYYYESQSMDEISQITGLTVSNIKVKIHRARKRMYILLHEMLKEEVYSLM